MTNEKESLTGKIIVFLDGETLFSVNGNNVPFLYIDILTQFT